jgi:hypothetical protein
MSTNVPSAGQDTVPTPTSQFREGADGAQETTSNDWNALLHTMPTDDASTMTLHAQWKRVERLREIYNRVAAERGRLRHLLALCTKEVREERTELLRQEARFHETHDQGLVELSEGDAEKLARFRAHQSKRYLEGTDETLCQDIEQAIKNAGLTVEEASRIVGDFHRAYAIFDSGKAQSDEERRAPYTLSTQAHTLVMIPMNAELIKMGYLDKEITGQ